MAKKSGRKSNAVAQGNADPDDETDVDAKQILEKIRDWRSILLINEPHNVTEARARQLQRLVSNCQTWLRQLQQGASDCQTWLEISDEKMSAWKTSTLNVLSQFSRDVQHITRIVGQAHGVRGSDLLHESRSIRGGAWADLVAAISIRKPIPSTQQTPTKAWSDTQEQRGRQLLKDSPEMKTKDFFKAVGIRAAVGVELLHSLRGTTPKKRNLE